MMKKDIIQEDETDLDQKHEAMYIARVHDSKLTSTNERASFVLNGRKAVIASMYRKLSVVNIFDAIKK